MKRTVNILEVIAHKKGDGLNLTRTFVKGNTEAEAQAELNKGNKGLFRVMASYEHTFETILDDDTYLAMCKVVSVDGVKLDTELSYKEALERFTLEEN